MKAAAQHLNIKGHYCGATVDKMVFLYAPTDIEGHIGKDNRFYVLDFARVFPPTCEEE